MAGCPRDASITAHAIGSALVVADAAALVADFGNERLLRYRLSRTGSWEIVIDRTDRPFLHRPIHLFAERRTILFFQSLDVGSEQGLVGVGGKLAVSGVGAEDVEIAISESAIRLVEFGERRRLVCLELADRLLQHRFGFSRGCVGGRRS